VGLEKIHFLVLRAGRGDGRLFHEVCRLVKDRRIEEARDAADRVDSPFARIVSGVLRIRHGHKREELQNMLDEAYLREIPVFHRRLPLLAVSANLSTLLGLLGTIAGLIIAFEAVAGVAAAQRTAALAGGISVAMATTGFGLLVAIPTLALHGLLGARADRAVEEIDSNLAVLAGLLSEWNRSPQNDPYEPRKMGISGTEEERIAEFVEAGGGK
jgi:biopolymer transport protein ExbB/TolQ